MEKKQISGLVSILISAAIAIAALWGYNIVVVQPMAEQVAQNTADLYGWRRKVGIGPSVIRTLPTWSRVAPSRRVRG